MIVMQANYDPLRSLAPGTPVVALDSHDRPVAVGTTLSADPARQPGEIARFTVLALNHSRQVGDYANVLSTGLRLGAESLPNQARALGQTATVVSFLATGVSFANEIDQGDGTRIAVAGFKFGASALAVIDETLLPGIPALHISSQVCKLASAALSGRVFALDSPARSAYTRVIPGEPACG